LINVVTSSMDMSYFYQEMEEAVKNGSDVFFAADSIEELAEKTGIDKEGLKSTIENYNEYCKKEDKEFSKNPKYMIPIDGNKFYALKFVCAKCIRQPGWNQN